jgi:hypothetical protein
MINLNLGEKTEKIGILEKIEFFFILNFYYIRYPRLSIALL